MNSDSTHTFNYIHFCSLDPECKAAKEGLKTLDNSLSESVEIQSEEEEEMLDKEAVLTPFQAHINVSSLVIILKLLFGLKLVAEVSLAYCRHSVLLGVSLVCNLDS